MDLYEEIPRNGDERSILLGFLEWQRSMLVFKCKGLEPDQLRIRSVEPSNLDRRGREGHRAEGGRGGGGRRRAGEHATER